MANLEALRDLDTSEATAVLATAAQIASRDTGLGQRADLIKQWGPRADAVLAELTLRVKSRNEGSSVERELFKAIRATSTGDRSSEQILGRAGDAGKLPLGMYSVSSTTNFERTFRPLGVSKKLLEDAIHRPTEYQHLLIDLISDDDELDQFSLFLLKRPARKKVAAHWLLVQTYRSGTVQIAQSAWWIHPSVVDLKAAEHPVDVLRAFVERFGVPIDVGTGTKHKLIVQETFPKMVGSPAKMSVTVEERIGDNNFKTWSWRTNEDSDHFYVGLAYAVDMNSYRKSLKDLGLM